MKCKLLQEPVVLHQQNYMSSFISLFTFKLCNMIRTGVHILQGDLITSHTQLTLSHHAMPPRFPPEGV